MSCYNIGLEVRFFDNNCFLIPIGSQRSQAQNAALIFCEISKFTFRIIQLLKVRVHLLRKYTENVVVVTEGVGALYLVPPRSPVAQGKCSLNYLIN